MSEYEYSYGSEYGSPKYYLPPSQRLSLSSSSSIRSSLGARKNKTQRRKTTSVSAENPHAGLFSAIMNDPEKKLQVFDLLCKEGLVPKPEVLFAGGASKSKELLKNLTSGAQKMTVASACASVSNAQKNTRIDSPSSLYRILSERKKQTEFLSDSSEYEPQNTVPFDKILAGVVGFCEVKSKGGDRSAAVKAMMVSMGATVVNTFTRDVTHVVFRDGNYMTYQRAKLLEVHLVSVLWLEACRKYGCKVPEKKYPALGLDAYYQDRNITTLCEEMQQDYENAVQDDRKLRRESRNLSKSFSTSSSQRHSLAVSSLNTKHDTSSTKSLLQPVYTRKSVTPLARRISMSSSSSSSFSDIVAPSQDFDGLSAVSNLLSKSKIVNEEENEDTSDCDVIINGKATKRKDSLELDGIAKLCDPPTITTVPPKTKESDSSATVSDLMKDSYSSLCLRISEESSKNSKQNESNEAENTDPNAAKEVPNADVDVTDIPTIKKKISESIKRTESILNSRKRTSPHANEASKCTPKKSPRKTRTVRQSLFQDPQSNKNLSKDVQKIKWDASKESDAQLEVTNQSVSSEKTVNQTPRQGVRKLFNLKEALDESFFNWDAERVAGETPKAPTGTFKVPVLTKSEPKARKRLGIKSSKTKTEVKVKPQIDKSKRKRSTGKKIDETSTSEEEMPKQIRASKRLDKPNLNNRTDGGKSTGSPVKVLDSLFAKNRVSYVTTRRGTQGSNLTRKSPRLNTNEDSKPELKAQKPQTKGSTRKTASKGKTVVNEESPKSEYHTAKSQVTDKTDLVKRRQSARLKQKFVDCIGNAADRRSTLDFVEKRSRQSLARLKSQTPKPTNKKLPGIVCTRFHRPEVHEFEQIVKQIGGFIVEQEVTKRTTHVVAAEPVRTVNMLRAIARGCWVLKKDWLYLSLEKGKWLCEENYELVEFSGAVRKCRQQRQSFGKLFCTDIFKECGPIYVSRNSTPRSSDLEELIDLCGGTVVSTARDARIVVGEPIRHDHIVCVSEKWILDSVTFYDKQSFEKYLLGTRKSIEF